jgi:hypothetical protein
LRLVEGLVVLLLSAAASASAGSGWTYRFEADGRRGTTWVAGDDSRTELEAAQDARGVQVEIIVNGGEKVLLVSPAAGTYYDAVAYHGPRPGFGALGREPTLKVLTATGTFEVERARKIKVSPLPLAKALEGLGCRPTGFAFSYELDLRIVRAGVSVPAKVEGRLELCLADEPAGVALAPGDGLQLRAGIDAVDAAFAERLSTLRGVPLRRAISATRTIENGEAVSETKTLLLSGFQPVEVPAERFQVPPGYRYEEPSIVGPARQTP